MDSIKINIKGYENLLAKLKAYPVKKAKAIDQVLERGSIRIANTAKRYLVSQTERSKNLQNQIFQDKTKEGWQIYVRADYAPYVEFGTGDKVKIPAGKGPYASQFRGRGIRKVNLRARPFMFPSYRRHEKEIRKAAFKVLKVSI